MTLQSRHVTKVFGGIVALDDCSVSIPQKGITSIIGPNGAGKTTLFDILSGFTRPDSGKVWWKSNDLTKFSPDKRVHKGIVRTFQLVKIFPNMTVLENVVFAKKQFSERSWVSVFAFWKVSSEQKHIQEKALEVLGYVGLEKKADMLASELSFGEQKLLEVARAIILDAELILLDEPAAGVSPMMKENVKVILQNLARHGIGICLIEHDIKFIMDISDLIIVMDRGREVMTGTPSEVLHDKRILDVYLGRSNA